MWGFQPIMDDSPLSKKLLNDQLESLWNKVMGNLDTKDFTKSTRGAIEAAVGASTEIEQTRGLIALKADKSQTDALQSAVEEQHAQLTITAEAIEQKVDKSVVDSLTDTISKQGTQITQTAEEIALKADSSAVSALNSRVAMQEAQLSLTAAQIESKVSVNDIGTQIIQNKDSIQLAVGNVGGANLLRNGYPHFGEKSWSFAGNTTSNQGKPTNFTRNVFYLTPAVNGLATMTSSLVYLDTAVEYTVSLSYAVNVSPGEYADIEIYVVYPPSLNNIAVEKMVFVGHVPCNVNERSRFSGTFTAEYAYAFIMIRHAHTAGRTAWIYDLACQRGAKGTDWTPHPNEFKNTGVTIDENEITFDSHRITFLLRSYDDPEAIALRMSSDDKGFDKLVVGELVAGNSPTILYTQRELFISPSGNDGNDGLSTVSPKATISGALGSLPRILDADVKLSIMQGTDYREKVNVSGFSGRGSLSISPNISWGTGMVRILGQAEIRNNTIPIHVGAIQVESSQHPVIRVEANTSVLLEGTRATGSNKGNQHGITVLSGTCRLTDCIAEYCSTGINVEGAFVHAFKCSGTNNGISGSVGIAARRCAMVLINSTIPNGASANSYSVEGGTILGSGTATASAGTSPASGTYTTQTFRGYYSTYRNGQWRFDSNGLGRAIQGDYTGDGLNMGVMIFSGLSSALLGKSMQSAKLFIRRRNAGGYSDERPVFVGLCNAANTSVTPTATLNTNIGSLAWGQEKWLQMPLNFMQYIAATSAFQGLCIYTTTNAKQNYVILEGEPLLEVVYA